MIAWLPLAAILLIIVMTTSAKAWAYVAGKPVEIDLRSIGNGMQMRADAARAFSAMRSAASDAGVSLIAESGFRTMAEQERLHGLFQQGTGNLAARPGYSNHQSGIAVDIRVGNSFVSKEYLWLQANAGKFGFVNTGATFSQKEPWHWEFRPS